MPIKILVVDDEPSFQPLIRQIFRQQIRQEVYEFTFALDGLEAFELLCQNSEIEIILTDINMPRIDGLTLLSRLKTINNCLNPALTTIIISAYDDMGNIRQAMNAGAYDFLTKPIDYQDLRATLEKAARHVEQLKQAFTGEQEAREALYRLNDELERRVKERTVELENTNNLLRASNAELDAFAHTVAHDLKNPLAVIFTFGSFLVHEVEELDQPTFKGILTNLYTAAQKASDIVDALLLLASARQDKVKISPIQMTPLIETVQNRLAVMVKEYQGEIILPSSWPNVLGYAPWIEEIWVNYLSNGLKYGGVPPRLVLGATPQPNGQIRFWVKDNGPGLTPAAQTKLFTEFTRLDHAHAEGHGLGLSIVRRIVEKMGGHAGVESTGIPGQGSLFYFTLAVPRGSAK